MIAHTLETARAADCPELLDFLQDAFSSNDSKSLRFETMYPDLFGVTDAAMARHRIIREDGKICACVGWYPMRVNVGPCAVDVCGIGQVSCGHALRGGGRMTALMNDVCGLMEKSGAGLAWLSGRRDRYARFGFEVAGTNLSSGIAPYSVGEPEAGWKVEQVNASHLPRFWTLRNRAAVCEEVSPETWITRLMRGGKTHRIFLASRGKDVEAMCVVQAESGENVCEWAGATAGIHAIVAHLLKTQRRVRVEYAPACVDPAANVFWNAADWCGTSMACLRILNLAALLKSYAPLLEKRVPKGAGVKLAIENADDAQLGVASGDALTLDRLTMTRVMFGSPAPSAIAALPEKLRWLDQVFPLPFMLPQLSHV